MNDERTNMEKAALALYYYAAELLKEGKTEAQVVDILIERGISRETAENMLTKLNVSVENVQRRRGYRETVFGVVITVLAILPLFGIFVDRVEGVSLIVTILLLAIGLVIVGRGLIKILGVQL